MSLLQVERPALLLAGPTFRRVVVRHADAEPGQTAALVCSAKLRKLRSPLVPAVEPPHDATASAPTRTATIDRLRLTISAYCPIPRRCGDCPIGSYGVSAHRAMLVDVGAFLAALVIGCGFLLTVRIQRPRVAKWDMPARPTLPRYALGRLRGLEIMGRALVAIGVVGVIVVGITRLYESDRASTDRQSCVSGRPTDATCRRVHRRRCRHQRWTRPTRRTSLTNGSRVQTDC